MRLEHIINKDVSENVKLSADLSVDDRRKCITAVQLAQAALVQRNFGSLLNMAPTVFRAGPIMGQHGWTDPKTGTCIIDGTWYDEDGTLDCILHELGHRLHLRQSLFKKAAILFRFFDPETLRDVGPYGRTNQHEMFAELFRRYIRGRLSDKNADWMGSIARR